MESAGAKSRIASAIVGFALYVVGGFADADAADHGQAVIETAGAEAESPGTLLTLDSSLIDNGCAASGVEWAVSGTNTRFGGFTQFQRFTVPALGWRISEIGIVARSRVDAARTGLRGNVWPDDGSGLGPDQSGIPIVSLRYDPPRSPSCDGWQDELAPVCLEPGHYWFQFDDNEDANYEASVLVGLSGGPAFSRRKFDLIQFSHEPLALRIFGVEGPCLLVISVDVKPDDPSNSINPFSRGVVPIALLGSESFDVADVDTDTLRFGPGQGEIAHRSGPHLVDIDGDGLMDLLGHFRTEESGLSTEETAACVTGETRDGTPFEGCDAVQIVPLF